MKILTVLGTRPEIIRLSLVIGKLDALCDHVLVHTGQNFDARLSDLFFDELRVRKPNHHLGVQAASFGEQVGKILASGEKVLRAEKPDRILLLGDTNSGLVAIVAKRLGIPVYHMEAGNRCYDDRVPEEVNRRIIDHSSDVLMPYSERSRANLLREGVPGERIYVTGNPILEVIEHYEPEIRESRVLDVLEVEPGKYLLVTMHRAENVDVEERLAGLTAALDRLQKEYNVPVVVSTHPHTRKRMESLGLGARGNGVRYLPPFGLFDFVKLERNALCVLSDSGTVQEECCIFQVANVTLRDVTERPETIECGSNILSGADPESVLECVKTVLSQRRSWSVPLEYLRTNVSDVVTRILLGYRLLNGRICPSARSLLSKVKKVTISGPTFFPGHAGVNSHASGDSAPQYPKVSVVIPVYNGAQYIQECVESALAQTYANIEVIVVDDGSTDATPKILSGFAGRIRRIRQKNGGTGAALNTGIRAADGELVAWLSADDLFLPEKIGAQVARFAEDPSLCVVYTDWIEISADDRERRVVRSPCPEPGDFATELLRGNFINGSSVVARRRCFVAAGYFDETLATDSDGDMWFKLLREGCLFGRVAKPLTKYRWHSGNLSRKYRQHHLCMDAVRARAIQAFSPRDLFGQQRNAEPAEISTRYEKVALLLARQLLFRAACEAMKKSSACRHAFRGRLLIWLFRIMSGIVFLSPLLFLRKAYSRLLVRGRLTLRR